MKNLLMAIIGTAALAYAALAGEVDLKTLAVKEGGNIVFYPDGGQLWSAAAKTLADCQLSIQFDNVDLRELGCEELLHRARLSGADGVQIERCEFYLDGERRVEELGRLGREVRFFEKAGYPVAVWTSSLGYGRMTDGDFLRRFPKFRPLRSMRAVRRRSAPRTAPGATLLPTTCATSSRRAPRRFSSTTTLFRRAGLESAVRARSTAGASRRGLASIR